MLRSFTASLLLALLWACDTGTEPEPDPTGETGSVTVTAVTTGADLDPEYGVTIGSAGGTVPGNGSVTLTGLPVGAATVELTDVAANCAVTGSASQSVTVVAGTTVDADFAVVCEAILDANALLAEAIDSMEEAMFSALNTDSVAQLDEFSFAQSNALFRQALTASPSNDTASFGAAVTGIFLLEDHPDVRALVDEWDAWLQDDEVTPPSPIASLLEPAVSVVRDPLTLPLGFSAETVEQVAYSGRTAYELAGGPALAEGAPPSMADHQTVLREVVKPALVEALEHLLEITNQGFTFTMTEAMQGEEPIDADPLELDYTEILAMRAGLLAAVAAVDVATAYILTPNPLDTQGFIDALTPGSTFLTLASGGADNLEDALARLQSCGTTLLTGLDVLEAETDDQTDDIIKIGPNDLTAQDVQDARALIQDILDALSAPTTVTVDEGGEDEFSFTLDAREFFINPITDFKALFAPYEVFTAVEDGETVPFFRWTQLNLDEWTVPDPTLSGILPGMTTTSDLFDFGFDEIFFDLSLTGGYYTLITVDGVDCVADSQGGGSGCPFAGGHVHYGSIDLDGWDGEPYVHINLGGPENYLYSSGSYGVVDNQDGTYTVDMDTVLEDGSGTPLVWTGTFTDLPGFSHVDQFYRQRGGSTIVVSYQGSEFVFEAQSW